MSLLERMRANQCAVRGCENDHAKDAVVCSDDLTELWAKRLIRQTDGTYTRLQARFPTARDLTGSMA